MAIVGNTGSLTKIDARQLSGTLRRALAENVSLTLMLNGADITLTRDEMENTVGALDAYAKSDPTPPSAENLSS